METTKSDNAIDHNIFLHTFTQAYSTPLEN